jgi:N-methylhydantoinase A
MRYVDQVHECEVEIGTFKIDRDTAKQIRDAFDARHEQLFTYSEPHNIVEIVNLESTIYGRIKRPESPVVDRGGADPAEALSGTRPMIFSRDGGATDTPVYDGEKVKAGNKFTGPAVIEEVTTTLVLEPGWEAELDERGTYVLTDKG